MTAIVSGSEIDYSELIAELKLCAASIHYATAEPGTLSSGTTTLVSLTVPDVQTNEQVLAFFEVEYTEDILHTAATFDLEILFDAVRYNDLLTIESADTESRKGATMVATMVGAGADMDIDLDAIQVAGGMDFHHALIWAVRTKNR